MTKREIDVAVISDIHLGTYGCHAKELVHYLKSISPQLLILNGDVIDGHERLPRANCRRGERQTISM